MTMDNSTVCDALALGEDADLQAVLSAWNAATVQLEQTHEALREEVRRLTDELEAKNRELARKNRLADLGRMAAHVAHEVRNNLVPVNLYLSLLKRRIAGDGENLGILAKIESGFAALETTVHDLLNFTSDHEPQTVRFFLRDLVDDIHASLALQVSAQAIEVLTDVPEELTVRGDRNMLRRAALNLTLNALDAMPHGGRLTFGAWAVEGGVELEISDTGPGLSEDTRARVFEPFFTTKSGGTGLGLAIVYRILDAHGGEIRAGNRSGGGAAFTLLLPDDGPQRRANVAADEEEEVKR